ncbi:MAG: DUF4390 domain-containing protein [Pseudomonadota bacterium]
MPRHLTHIAIGLLLLVMSGLANAQSGGVEIRSASTALVNDVYLANTRIQYQLSERIEEALAIGLALQVTLDYTIERQRRFLPDTEVAQVRVINLLRYSKVTERYTIRNENTGSQSSYATIFGALNALGRVDDLPLVDAALLSTDKRYRARVRAQVAIDDYPASLRYLLFWRDDWQISSSWFSWSLAQ